MEKGEIERKGRDPEKGDSLPDIAFRVGVPDSPASPVVSLTSLGADRAADGWDGRGLARLESAVSRAIAQFSPRRVPAAQWGRIESLVRDSAQKA